MTKVKLVKDNNDIRSIVKELFGDQAYEVDYLDYGEELEHEVYEEIATVYTNEEEFEDDQIGTIFLTHNQELYVHFFFEGFKDNWEHDTEIKGL